MIVMRALVRGARVGTRFCGHGFDVIGGDERRLHAKVQPHHEERDSSESTRA